MMPRRLASVGLVLQVPPYTIAHCFPWLCVQKGDLQKSCCHRHLAPPEGWRFSPVLLGCMVNSIGLSTSRGTLRLAGRPCLRPHCQ